MSGGDVDVALYLYSQNTIGHGKPKLKILNPKSNGGTVGYVMGLEELRWWWSKWVCGGVGGSGQHCKNAVSAEEAR